MSIIPILQYPNPRLKLNAHWVEDFKDLALQCILDNMLETLSNSKNCAALAASQLDIEKPPFATVISKDVLVRKELEDDSIAIDNHLCLLNIKILSTSGNTNLKEGCMSVMNNIYKAVNRAQRIEVLCCNRQGQELRFFANGFLAKCIQHELDHLHGKIFIDHLSSFSRKLVDQKLLKARLKKSPK
jgi:peptide deformylase